MRWTSPAHTEIGSDSNSSLSPVHDAEMSSVRCVLAEACYFFGASNHACLKEWGLS